MDIKPILAALRRHKGGTLLIGLQIALTLAIVCNALFIIQQRLVRVDRPSGVQESGLFVIRNDWPQKLSPQEADARMRADLQALRQLPAVQDASATNSYPLRGAGWDNGIRLSPEQARMTTDSAIFFSDDHTLATLGTRLIAGRNFRPDEIGSQDGTDRLHARQIIISKALAQMLFPGGSALGKAIYPSNDNVPSTVVGITDTLQSHLTGLWAQPYAYNAVLVPARLTGDGTIYLVRARAGRIDDAMHQARDALYAQSNMRLIPANDGMLTFTQVRRRAYDADYGMAILMAVISAVLLLITATGIVGLTSFWVAQRRRQIGVRRALGARQRDILKYFLTENLLITLGGVLLGVVLAVSMNVWLVIRLGSQPMSLDYLLAGALLLLLLGQGAVLAPALRASRVPPVEATRSV